MEGCSIVLWMFQSYNYKDSALIGSSKLQLLFYWFIQLSLVGFALFWDNYKEKLVTRQHGRYRHSLIHPQRESMSFVVPRKEKACIKLQKVSKVNTAPRPLDVVLLFLALALACATFQKQQITTRSDEACSTKTCWLSDPHYTDLAASQIACKYSNALLLYQDAGSWIPWTRFYFLG